MMVHITHTILHIILTERWWCTLRSPFTYRINRTIMVHITLTILHIGLTERWWSTLRSPLNFIDADQWRGCRKWSTWYQACDVHAWLRRGPSRRSPPKLQSGPNWRIKWHLSIRKCFNNIDYINNYNLKNYKTWIKYEKWKKYTVYLNFF